MTLVHISSFLFYLCFISVFLRELETWAWCLDWRLHDGEAAAFSLHINMNRVVKMVVPLYLILKQTALALRHCKVKVWEFSNFFLLLKVLAPFGKTEHLRGKILLTYTAFQSCLTCVGNIDQILVK